MQRKAYKIAFISQLLELTIDKNLKKDLGWMPLAERRKQQHLKILSKAKRDKQILTQTKHKRKYIAEHENNTLGNSK